MQESDLHLLELAQSEGILSRRQARQTLEALEADPSCSAAQLILQRNYATEAQLQALQRQLAPGAESLSGAPAGEAGRPLAEPPTSVTQPPPTPASPSRPPSQTASRPITSTGLTAPAATRTQTPAGIIPVPLHSPDSGAASAAPATPPPAPPEPPPPPPQAISPPTAEKMETLEDFLAAARQWGCSDVHLVVGHPPFMRRFGQIHFLEETPLPAARAAEWNLALLSEEQKERLNRERQLDFALDVPGLGRHRCSIYHQRNGWDGAYRIIPETPPRLEEMNLPPGVRALADSRRGVILVSGPARSGKSTTLAAILDYINRTRPAHIVAIEDPVEYALEPQKCEITQRELGAHTVSLTVALQAALREDPDVIFVGELRDRETITLVMSAGEVGHLALSSLPARGAPRTLSAILDRFPASERAQAGAMMAESMRGVISQQLLPRRDGQGLAAALEILIFHSGVAQQVREGKTHQIPSLIQAGKRMGMRLMEDSLMELFSQGIISGRAAYEAAENKTPFEAHKEKA